MIYHKYDEKLLYKLAEVEVKVSQLQALCIAKDSEILRLESLINDLRLNVKEMKFGLMGNKAESKAVSTQTQSDAERSKELVELKSENTRLMRTIEKLERELFIADLKRIEANEIIKNYGNSDIFTEPIINTEPAARLHKAESLPNKKFRIYHRANSQEEDIRIKSRQKFTINAPCNRSNADQSKVFTSQKPITSAFSSPRASKKKLSIPSTRFAFN